MPTQGARRDRQGPQPGWTMARGEGSVPAAINKPGLKAFANEVPLSPQVLSLQALSLTLPSQAQHTVLEELVAPLRSCTPFLPCLPCQVIQITSDFALPAEQLEGNMKI